MSYQHTSRTHRVGADAALAEALGRPAQVKPRAAFNAGVERRALDSELGADERDSRGLGLAKAIARQCVGLVGAERSRSAIEAVRELKAGKRGLGAQVGRHAMPAPRLLAAAPRGGSVSRSNDQRERTQSDRDPEIVNGKFSRPGRTTWMSTLLGKR